MINNLYIRRVNWPTLISPLPKSLLVHIWYTIFNENSNYGTVK